MNPQIVYLIAGLIGGALKAWATNSQETFSKRSVIDVILSGAAALLIPNFAPALIPTGMPLLTQAVLVGLLSYASTDFVQNMLGKAGVQAAGDAKP